MFYAYILYSATLGRFYVGQTEDLANRLKEHGQGRGIYTQQTSDWIVVYSEMCISRADAVLLEKKIKARGAGRFLADKGVVPPKAG